ncbi:MAG: Acetyl-CoA acetyltransferase [Syntrophorhabdus sp. PtaU1.Bin058]|nr:MAG: Acetyl-CoA acetyltransferase [Syntrophorhabdus sp. PtaU1.Bin058]
MKDIVIVGAARTPIGEFGGSLRDVPVVSLGITAINAAVERAGIEKQMIDQVIMGNCFDPADTNVTRITAVKAGIPIEAPAYTIIGTCGSGMQAIISGIHSIREGDADIVVAGGFESMSTAPYLLTSTRWGQRLNHSYAVDLLWRAMHEHPIGGGMGMTAENLAERYGITREEQDRFALSSQQRASKAVKDGRFKEEISPVVIPVKKGEPKVIDTDEYPKPNMTLEKLAQLQPAFKKDGTVTAGNACGINDAAAAVVLMTGQKATELGLKPLCRIVSDASVGVDPAYMGIGPVPASRKVLKRAGLSLDDIELFEINEAFAAQFLSCERELGLNREIVNVNGSGISLGHPVGATGTRLVVTLLYEMKKRGLKYGLASLCAGGGLGYALIIENY